MSTTLGPDMLHFCLRAYQLVDFSSIDSYIAFLSVSGIIVSLWFKLLIMFIPLAGFFSQSILQSSVCSGFMCATNNIQHAFLVQSNVFIKLFLLKLPFLLFEIILMLLLISFAKSQKEKKFAFILWILSPIVLYIVHVLGTVDVIAAFLFLLALFFLRKKNFLAGGFFIILSFFAKSYVLFAFPFVFIFIAKQIKSLSFHKRITLWISMIASFIAGIYLFFFSQESVIIREHLLSWPYEFIFKTGVGEIRIIYLFILVYLLVLFFYWYFFKEDFSYLLRTLLISFLTFFSLSFFHPQWFIIAVPLLIIAVLNNYISFKILVMQTIFYFLLLIQWNNRLIFDVFVPVNEAFFRNLPSITGIIDNFIPSNIFINICWTCFSAINIFIIYLLIRSMLQNKNSVAERNE